MAAAGKTIRFAQVVERSGRPHVHALWVAPEKDPEFQRALKSHRVMTLEQPGRGKTDVGFIGFDPKRNAPHQLLIFPKSLKRFAGARVIGIKFDLLDQPPLAAAGRLEVRNRPPGKRRGARAPAAGERPRTRTATRETPGRSSTRLRPKPEPSAAVPTPPPDPKPAPASAAKNDSALRREVRAALKELQQGRAVAAYQRLESALNAANAGHVSP